MTVTVAETTFTPQADCDNCDGTGEFEEGQPCHFCLSDAIRRGELDGVADDVLYVGGVAQTVPSPRGWESVDAGTDADTVPFGTVEPEVVDKTIGKAYGRGVNHGSIRVSAGKGGVLLRIEDDVNEAFWLDLILTRDELASLLLQCVEEAR